MTTRHQVIQEFLADTHALASEIVRLRRENARLVQWNRRLLSGLSWMTTKAVNATREVVCG